MTGTVLQFPTERQRKLLQLEELLQKDGGHDHRAILKLINHLDGMEQPSVKCGLEEDAVREAVHEHNVVFAAVDKALQLELTEMFDGCDDLTEPDDVG